MPWLIQPSSGGETVQWVAIDPRTPPSTPGACDDEFTDSATLPGGGAALWAWGNQGSTTVEIADSDYAKFTSGNTALVQLRVMERAASFPGDFTLTCRVASINTNQSGQTFGMCISDGTRYQTIMMAGASTVGTIGNWTNITTFNGTALTITAAINRSNVFFRLKKTGTTHEWQVSTGDQPWETLLSQSATAFLTGAITKVGICHQQNTTSVFNFYADFIRSVP